jgi:tetratricopeptide (TPR) repeat protein
LLYLRSKNTTVAQEELKKAIEIDPNYTLAYKELGEYYYLTKQGVEAVKAQEAYMKLMEKPEQEEFKLAFYLFMAKDYKRANAIFDKLLQKTDVTPKTIRFAARSRIESGDTLGSSKVFEQFFIKAKPEEIEGADYAYYGNMLKGLKKDSLAAVSFEKSIALDPDPAVIEQLAGMYYKNKKYADAARTYKLLLTKRVKITGRDYYNIGRAYYQNEQYAEADSAFTKLVESQPNMVVAYTWAGRAKSGLDPESTAGLAKPMYEKVIEKATPEKNKTDLIEAYRYMASYYGQKDDIKGAKTYLEKILTLDPNDDAAKKGIKLINETLSGNNKAGNNKPGPNQR